ncbi:hypothetical protein QAD02_020001 [Eretmocerus hayati]|uniref:Uncharacterized protein n=1 Tax=Eretmocerus hayati TaxID=131215 RepID=A0ACC2PLP3_9HYME|nr:hypothetical protein QAD02_020001 [Eretmocerus hayati]
MESRIEEKGKIFGLTKWEKEVSSKPSQGSDSHVLLAQLLFISNECYRPPDPMNRDKALIYASYMILIRLATVGFMHHGYRIAGLMGMRARVACCSLIYRKSLQLNKAVLDQTAAGQVVNLMSNDVSRFDTLFEYFNTVWLAPIQTLLILYVMWDHTGVMFLAGTGILIIMAIPIQSIVIYVGKILRSKIAVLTDKRVQSIGEIISGIQVVKMYAWEKPFEKIVKIIRYAEMKKVSTTTKVRSLFMSALDFVERAAIFATVLLLLLYQGRILSAEVSFVMITYLGIMQLSIIYFMSNGLVAIGETSVTIKRIELRRVVNYVSFSQEFLLLDGNEPVNSAAFESTSNLAFQKIEPPGDMKKALVKENQNAPIEVHFRRVSANWISGQLPPTLNDLTFKIEASSLCAITGAVGSGKSAILNLILKELPLSVGTIVFQKGSNNSEDIASLPHGYHVKVPNLTISYACQEAWLFAGTVRENILFGQQFDPVRYSEVTEVCALRRDFDQLPNGDLTVVGEHGTSLSGGQRARVNLARAVYRKADLYLLDDPLSAVDPQVARHLFDKCVCGFLSDKTRILVTHQLQFLQKVDTILFLDRGGAQYYGSYKNITNLDPKIMDVLNKIDNEEDKSLDHTAKTGLDDARRESMKKNENSNKYSDSISGQISEPETVSETLTEEENTQSTHSNFSLFGIYFRAGGSWCAIIFYLLILILTQVAASGVDVWFGHWTNVEDMRKALKNSSSDMVDIGYNSTSNVSDDLMPTSEAISIYAIILLALIILCISRNLLIVRISMRASRKLHNAMFSNLLHSTMSFFTKNPSGRILNRFSKDIGTLDELLPRSIVDTIQIFSTMVGILVIILLVDIWMAIPIIIIALVFYYVFKMYLRAAQNIKRLETSAKSPLFSHLNATISGLTTIRTNGPEIKKRLIREFDTYQDIHTGTWFLTIVTGSALAIFLDTVMVIFNALLVYSLILIDEGTIRAGSVGLALSQASILTGMVQHGFRLFVGIMTQLVSVERVVQYTNLPREHPLTSPTPLPDGWPKQGRIIMKNVSMRYEEGLPLVLKVSIDVNDKRHNHHHRICISGTSKNS